MLEPSRAFYVAVFGTMKAGAIAVPLFTLFGPDGVKLRVDDCKPQLLVTNAEKAPILAGIGAKVVVADDAFLNELERFRRTSRRTRGRRARHLPVHLGHDARIARGGQAHASRRS